MSTGGVSLRHQQLLAQGRFMIQRCGACAGAVYAPRTVCPHCGADALDWEVPSGLGTVHAVTTVARKAEEGGPYNVSLIDLDEGVRLMSRVDGLSPDQVRIGLRVRARVQVHDGQGLVLFDPVDGAAA